MPSHCGPSRTEANAFISEEGKPAIFGLQRLLSTHTHTAHLQTRSCTLACVKTPKCGHICFFSSHTVHFSPLSCLSSLSFHLYITIGPLWWPALKALAPQHTSLLIHKAGLLYASGTFHTSNLSPVFLSHVTSWDKSTNRIISARTVQEGSRCTDSGHTQCLYIKYRSTMNLCGVNWQKKSQRY